jgi:Skp family chaperone for outer membrane proteins
LHGEWFECSEELKDFINSCSSVDSTEFDDGILKLRGLGVGSGLGIGIGQEAEDQEFMSLKQQIMDKSREIFGVRIFPGDSNWNEVRSLARVYEPHVILDKFEQWAKSQQATPNYPLSAFIKIADGILAGKFSGQFPSAELSTLINELAVISDGRVVFNVAQRAAVARLVETHSSENVKSAFSEFWGNIENDDFAVRQAAKTFTEAAEQLLAVQARRREKERQTQELLRASTENEQRIAREEAEARLKAEVELQNLIEDTL